MKYAHRWRKNLPIILLVWLAVAPSWAIAATYRIAVVPQMSPLTVHKNWAPFLQRLSRETGHTFEIMVYRDVPRFESELTRGLPDFAYMNPFHQVLVRKSQGYIPMVRSSVESLVGIVVVRRDSPIKSLKDLDGKTVAFPAPNAFGASLYVRALLAEKANVHFTPIYLDTHTDVFRHVILERVDAGGAVTATLQRESREIRQQLRVVFETPPTAPHPLSAHPRVPAKDRQLVAEAILKLAADPSNTPLLSAVQLERPVRADYRRDYAPLEHLGLGKYVSPSPR
jgi:phosphonate transport system substrate-binding protein